MKIFLSSCLGSAAASVYCAEFDRLAKLSRTEDLRLVSAPEIADLILIVDIYEEGLYAGLRQNRIWQKWPEKSFAYCEIDSPPNFLHGLYSSASKALSRSGRFQACAYQVHQLCYPNPCPSMEELSATPKDLLFFFAGRASHRVRRQLFAQKFNGADVLVEDTSAYFHFGGCQPASRPPARRNYWQMASRSKYALCPRGAATSSVRIFEMMEAGIAPVIIADDWLPPFGPSWEEFALFIPEKEVGSIYEQVKPHETEYADRGHLARQAWERYFSPENYWSFILASVQRIQENQKLPESLYARSLPLLAIREWSRQRRFQTVIGLKSRLKKMFRSLRRGFFCIVRLPKKIG